MKNTGLEFLELTKYPHLSESDQEKDLPCPQLETPESGEQIDLPGPESISLAEISIQTAINNRRSLRKFSTTPLSMEELSWLLWATQGVKEKLSHATLRTVPSAGARHPFDTYLAVANVSGLKPGLYRYLALTHKLVLIREDSQIGEKVATACIKQKWIAKAAATFFWGSRSLPHHLALQRAGRRYIFLDMTASARTSTWPARPSPVLCRRRLRRRRPQPTAGPGRQRAVCSLCRACGP